MNIFLFFVLAFFGSASFDYKLFCPATDRVEVFLASKDYFYGGYMDIYFESGDKRELVATVRRAGDDVNFDLYRDKGVTIETKKSPTGWTVMFDMPKTPYTKVITTFNWVIYDTKSTESVKCAELAKPSKCMLSSQEWEEVKILPAGTLDLSGKKIKTSDLKAVRKVLKQKYLGNLAALQLNILQDSPKTMVAGYGIDLVAQRLGGHIYNGYSTLGDIETGYREALAEKNWPIIEKFNNITRRLVGMDCR